MEQQRTIEWFRARLGNFTGSQVGELMVSGRKKDEVFGKGALTYIYQVAAERNLNEAIVADDELFGDYVYLQSTGNKYTNFGTEQETYARQLYEGRTGEKVDETGSVMHKTIKHFSASPDGFVGKKGVLEIKSLQPKEFFAYQCQVNSAEELKAYNSKYYWQVVAELACSGRKWCDFTVYCPFMKQPSHTIRIERDKEAVKALCDRVKLANRLITKLNRKIARRAKKQASC